MFYESVLNVNICLMKKKTRIPKILLIVLIAWFLAHLMNHIDIGIVALLLLIISEEFKLHYSITGAVLALAGVFGMGFAPIFLVTAIKYIGAVQTSVLTSTSALFAVSISILILGEKLTRRAGLSIVATVIGVTIVLMGS